MKSALVSEFSHVPVTHGLPKDHKQLPESGIPPSRAVCGADESSNGPLSDILSEVISQLGDIMDEDLDILCTSTEEMIAGIENVNLREDIKKIVAFSMDVEKLYPSLEAAEVARVVAKEYLRSKLNIKVGNAELSLYLAIIKDPSEIQELGLAEVVNTRKGTRGARPGITTTEILKEDRTSKFNPPAREPTEEESRLMFSLALEEAVKVVMNNHLYNFNGVIKRQLRGGPIGLKISGSLAKVYMLYWSRCFKEALAKAVAGDTSDLLYLLKVYVDDTGLVTEELPPGSRFKDGKITIMEEFI